MCPKYLIDTSSENRQTDFLKIELNEAIKDTEIIFKEPEIQQEAITIGFLDHDIFVAAEAETDLQFTYKKQVFSMTPGTDKESSTTEENVTLLNVCENAICI